MFRVMWETADDEQFCSAEFATAKEAAEWLVEALSEGGLASEKIPGDFHWAQMEPVE